MPELTQQGIAALKAGDKPQAAHLLRLAIQDNPKDVQAWLWLSGAVDTVEERVESLQAVLRLDPNNQVAARGLAQLVSQGVVNLQPVGTNKVASLQPLSQSAPIPQARNVLPQEEIIFKEHPAWGFMFVGLGLLVSVFLGFSYFLFKNDSTRILFATFSCMAGIAIFIGVIQIIALWATSRYTLTNKKLIVEKGLFTHQRKVIPIEKIQDVGYHREFIQIIFGVGDVVVESAGERGQVRLSHLRKYRERSETILSLIQKNVN